MSLTVGEGASRGKFGTGEAGVLRSMFLRITLLGLGGGYAELFLKIALKNLKFNH
jgi:hypothetical protein